MQGLAGRRRYSDFYIERPYYIRRDLRLLSSEIVFPLRNRYDFARRHNRYLSGVRSAFIIRNIGKKLEKHK